MSEESIKKAKKKKEPSYDRNGRLRHRCVTGYVLITILMFVAVTIRIASRYFQATYTMGTKELLYTMTTPLKGTSWDVVKNVLHGTVMPIIKRMGVYAFIAFFTMDIKVTDWMWCWCKKIDFRRIFRYIGVALVLAYCYFAYTCLDSALNLNEYFRYQTETSTLYDDNYVEPADVKITAPEKKKNLVLLYMESMETTYASGEEGGNQPVDYMPNLTQLAYDNTSFTDKADGKLGGFVSGSGTSWTMGALLATSSGVSYAFPLGNNSMSRLENFAPAMTTLGDVLEDNGYSNEFLCGSDAEFGGRANYFEQHGDYYLYDYFRAIKNGDIPSDYKVWWGFEDSKLYDIAKREITRLAGEDKPFNFTFLTVDTHHSEGYVCDLCREDYDSTTANVVSCADRQAGEFVEWLKQQPFFEDTVLVITGDHPRMDNYLVFGVGYHDRTVYNCIINSDRQADDTVMTNRQFTAMDMYPTILYALGFDIEGNRLGIGTNMYSGEKTLAETMGVDALYDELNKKSQFYLDKFWVTKPSKAKK